ncbi:hypothetical protein [Pseudoroseicyclus aestuarii]|uniref:Hpt domain-containing protein n=1 Tax=Pseudoroseicyclus aestuarii TaxID=1795041 RepID=A0A318SR41_9RHOB|nr:hypothetical protein [Pseudoroseicyclus aestuarii]PYE84280.1 hypothetical protein DFP88_10275 [Pseudoroseicyclus aestuarii]
MIAALGPQAATQRLDRGREDLMHRLDRLQTAHRAHELRSVLSDAMATADLAGELGLSDLHRVALDVAGCAGRNDGAALSATLARLLRLGEHAADRIAALGPAAG